MDKQFIIQCSFGSYAEEYARKHHIKYQLDVMSPQMRHMVDEIIVFCIGRGKSMGFFVGLFGRRIKFQRIISILPLAAKQEIQAGRLPVLNTDKLIP